jgi:hypothetical protein
LPLLLPLSLLRFSRSSHLLFPPLSLLSLISLRSLLLPLLPLPPFSFLTSSSLHRYMSPAIKGQAKKGDDMDEMSLEFDAEFDVLVECALCSLLCLSSHFSSASFAFFETQKQTHKHTHTYTHTHTHTHTHSPPRRKRTSHSLRSEKNR